ncbi:MAG: hypothetical protein LBG92_07465 [Prevotellaceae bacterium]|jgi:hypothetical protein|nr:hypothetical protein [Prevotellaceae bacterium]
MEEFNADMEPEQSVKEDIVNLLKEKSSIKQAVYDNTFETFSTLKDVLHELINEINEDVFGSDRRIKIDYRDRGKFEAEARIAEDILIFSMHSNIFEFDRAHFIRKTSYIQKNQCNSYCGIISIYNFLADSFKYNRINDLGYLIARIFVNHEKHFFVEGKRQMNSINDFASQVIDETKIRTILEKAILYALRFDLLVPPYDEVKIATVEQVNTKIENGKLKTGKRLGFQFKSDDILI